MSTTDVLNENDLNQNEVKHDETVDATNEPSPDLEANSDESDIQSNHEEEASTVPYVIPMRRGPGQTRTTKPTRPRRERQQPKWMTSGEWNM
jgi:hypothetical protein